MHYDFTQFGLDRSQATLARTLRTSLIVDPQEREAAADDAKKGRGSWPQRAEEAKRLGGRWDSAQSNQLDDRCIIMAGPGPPMMDAAYNSNYQIVQAPGYVMILTEMIHDVRIIPLDGRPQPPSERASVDGRLARPLGRRHARRRDDELQREESVQGLDENMKVIERLRRVADDTIEYNFTVEDKSMWARPWSAEAVMRKTAVRCSSTRATKATSVSTTRSSAPGSRSRRPPKRAAKKDSK